MTDRIWPSNDELSQEQDLTVTRHRDDGTEPDVAIADQIDAAFGAEDQMEEQDQEYAPDDRAVPQEQLYDLEGDRIPEETTSDTLQEVLEEQGEDVSSSPARRASSSQPESVEGDAAGDPGAPSEGKPGDSAAAAGD